MNKRNSIEESPSRETRAQKQQRVQGANAASSENENNISEPEVVISPTVPKPGKSTSAWEKPPKIGKNLKNKPAKESTRSTNRFNPLVVDDDSQNSPSDTPAVNSAENIEEGEVISTKPAANNSPSNVSSGSEDEKWRREESDDEEDIDLDDSSWTKIFQDAANTVYWFSIIRAIPNNSSTGWAAYLSKITKIPILVLEGITKVVKGTNILVEVTNLSEEWVNRLKDVNTESLAFSPGNSISDAEATLLVYIGKINDKLSNVEVASNGMHLVKRMAEKKGVTIDKIVTRFVENAKFPCLFLIFKNANDAFKIFDKGTGKCSPLFEEKLGVIAKPIPDTLRCMNKFKWRKLEVKNIGYNDDTVIQRMQEFSAFDKYHDMIGLICHNRNFKSGAATRNATIIAKPKLIFKIAEIIREKMPSGIGLKGVPTPITAELVNDDFGRANNK